MGRDGKQETVASWLATPPYAYTSYAAAASDLC